MPILWFLVLEKTKWFCHLYIFSIVIAMLYLKNGFCISIIILYLENSLFGSPHFASAEPRQQTDALTAHQHTASFQSPLLNT